MGFTTQGKYNRRRKVRRRLPRRRNLKLETGQRCQWRHIECPLGFAGVAATLRVFNHTPIGASPDLYFRRARMRQANRVRGDAEPATCQRHTYAIRDHVTREPYMNGQSVCMFYSSLLYRCIPNARLAHLHVSVTTKTCIVATSEGTHLYHGK